MNSDGVTSYPTTPLRHSTARPGDEIAPTRYRKKPVEIEAIRWSGTNLKEVIDFTGLHPSADKWTWEEYTAVVRKRGLKIFSLEGSNFIVTNGDYIIKGVKGEFYACKPDIFWLTYQRADASMPASETNTGTGQDSGELPAEPLPGATSRSTPSGESPASSITDKNGTPRTDAVEDEQVNADECLETDPGFWAMRDHARQLERELAVANTGGTRK
jgi:hypothetical protein